MALNTSPIPNRAMTTNNSGRQVFGVLNFVAQLHTKIQEHIVHAPQFEAVQFLLVLGQELHRRLTCADKPCPSSELTRTTKPESGS